MLGLGVTHPWLEALVTDLSRLLMAFALGSDELSRELYLHIFFFCLNNMLNILPSLVDTLR